ncbi:hypothetical protein FAY30_03210 [Bacillus sp. S3]|uniref:hypothetical protein n=1 Tax=Bacillus sp. S3 TaxID=486398 RepID=UPI0011898C96|nr:hypothetical protein [Bacillus sp. S3]QCJ40997.1 hypothetical protein FAY30_03210 [Bacillus sp. S3]
MINEKYNLICCPTFSLSPGEEVEVNLQLERKTPPALDDSLTVKIKRKKKKIIVKGRSEPYAIIEISIGERNPIKTTSDCMGYFKVRIKKRLKGGKRLTIKIIAFPSCSVPETVTIIL